MTENLVDSFLPLSGKELKILIHGPGTIYRCQRNEDLFSVPTGGRVPGMMLTSGNDLSVLNDPQNRNVSSRLPQRRVLPLGGISHLNELLVVMNHQCVVTQRHTVGMHHHHHERPVVEGSLIVMQTVTENRSAQNRSELTGMKEELMTAGIRVELAAPLFGADLILIDLNDPAHSVLVRMRVWTAGDGHLMLMLTLIPNPSNARNQQPRKNSVFLGIFDLTMT